MIFKQTLGLFTTHRLIKVISLLVLIIAARQVFADCAADANNGWSIGEFCGSEFDNNGNYSGSFCQPDRYDDPSGTYHLECIAGIDYGTCTGSNCEGAAGCTYHGVCQSDFDCCGLNWCDTDITHKCQDWDSGGDY